MFILIIIAICKNRYSPHKLPSLFLHPKTPSTFLFLPTPILYLSSSTKQALSDLL